MLYGSSIELTRYADGVDTVPACPLFLLGGKKVYITLASQYILLERVSISYLKKLHSGLSLCLPLVVGCPSEL